MKSQWFSKPAYYEFAKLIESAGAGGGMRFHETFDRFLFCAYAALRQAVHKMREGEICAELEAEYMKTIKTIDDPSAFSDAMALLVEGLENEPCDFLGDVYGQIGMADVQCRGQVFTPGRLSKLIGELSLPAEPDPAHRFTIYEPCVGGGSIVIHAAEMLKARGFSPRDYFVWAADISRVCFHMAYIQLTLLGIPALVMRQNSLQPDENDLAAPTFLAALYPYRRPLEEPADEITIDEISPTISPIPDMEFEETLFG